MTFRTIPRIVDEQDPRALALRFTDAAGSTVDWSFGRIAELSRRAAAWLSDRGLSPGDRLATIFPQHPAVPVLHVGALRLGGVVAPISPLFGSDALAQRLSVASPRVVVAHASKADAVAAALAASGFPRATLEVVGGAESFFGTLPAERRLPPEPRDSHAAAYLMSTSGTTAAPKAAALPHRVIDGRLAGLRLAHEPFPVEGDLFWSPADWSWIGGLHDALLAPWACGVGVYAYERARAFDAGEALARIAEAGVSRAFLPPTAVREFLARGGPSAGLALRSLHTAGEPLPAPVAQAARAFFGVDSVEVYGLTECAFLIGGASRAWPTRAGWTGKPYPGHRIALLDEHGRNVAPGALGEIAVAIEGDPTLCLGYWNGPALPPTPPWTDGWLRTGDLAIEDSDGYVRVVGRADDLIKSAGYRIGPAEVEAALLSHAAVAQCAVVGIPDERRGQAVVAFVVPAKGGGGAPLAAELTARVRDRVGPHAAPRTVEFVDELPQTVTGKVVRAALRQAAGSPKRAPS